MQTDPIARNHSRAGQVPAVLCVDNSTLDQKAIRLALDPLVRARTVRLLFASSTSQALQVLSEQLVHVVLLDIDLRPEEFEAPAPHPPAAEIPSE